MDRLAHALLQVSLGKGATRQFPLSRIIEYEVTTAIDNDADSFSISLGDKNGDLLYLTDRDVETRLTIFLSNKTGHSVPIFSGIADDVSFSSDDPLIALSGRDMSALAVDSDAPAGRWRHVKPKQFIEQRARKIGLTDLAIASMREIGSLWTDASETEWQFWYRIARSRDMFIWTGPLGGLFIDHLHYKDDPDYFFGTPRANESGLTWYMPEVVSVHSTKQSRKHEVWVYGEDQKTGRPFYARSLDKTIQSWRRKSISIVTSSTAKSNAEARKDADEEVFESIVGAWQIELVVPDTGFIVKQNRMARLHLPPPLDHLNGVYFVTGVTRQGGEDGFRQVIRLRERNYALSKRVPDAPRLTQPNDAAGNKVPSNLASLLSLATTEDGRSLPWADHFIQATREFGVPHGWDFAVFLGTLLSICQIESSFRNVRGNGDYQWQPYDVFIQDPRNQEVTREAELQRKYEKLFANAQHNSDNPRYPSSESAVGPMQLVTPGYKVWADEYGWLGKPNHNELTGGRWNPNSNIRAAARALIEKLAVAPSANPNEPNTIWIGVARYYGSNDGNANTGYANRVKSAYDNRWYALAQSTLAAGETLPLGTQTKITYNGVTVELPTYTPDVIKKAVNFCMRRLGDPYQWGGAGPRYDCSSLVTAAYAAASPTLRAQLNEPDGRNHGEDTYTLTAKGRFPSIPKSSLLPGDLVFFTHPGGRTPEHVGMFLGEGRMIHDPKTGDVVKISGINSDYYNANWYGARRLVEWTSPHDLPLPGP